MNRKEQLEIYSQNLSQRSKFLRDNVSYAEEEEKVDNEMEDKILGNFILLNYRYERSNRTSAVTIDIQF
jgi:hypothetical protein